MFIDSRLTREITANANKHHQHKIFMAEVTPDCWTDLGMDLSESKFRVQHVHRRESSRRRNGDSPCNSPTSIVAGNHGRTRTSERRIMSLHPKSGSQDGQCFELQLPPLPVWSRRRQGCKLPLRYIKAPRIYEPCRKRDGVRLIVHDHGNCASVVRKKLSFPI